MFEMLFRLNRKVKSLIFCILLTLTISLFLDTSLFEKNSSRNTNFGNLIIFKNTCKTNTNQTDLPYSNYLEDIEIDLNDEETITWELFDDSEGDYYIRNYTIYYNDICTREGELCYSFEYNDTSVNNYSTLLSAQYQLWVDVPRFYACMSVKYNKSGTYYVLDREMDYNAGYNYEYYPDDELLIFPDLVQISEHSYIDLNPITDQNLNEDVKDFRVYFRANGLYRVLRNHIVYINWTEWSPWDTSTKLNVNIDSSEIGSYNYTIQFLDDEVQSIISDTVIVKINEPNESSNNNNNNKSDFSISPLQFILIISGALTASLIFIFIKKKSKNP